MRLCTRCDLVAERMWLVKSSGIPSHGGEILLSFLASHFRATIIHSSRISIVNTDLEKIYLTVISLGWIYKLEGGGSVS